jgi:hypothetical protein
MISETLEGPGTAGLSGTGVAADTVPKIGRPGFDFVKNRFGRNLRIKPEKGFLESLTVQKQHVLLV